MNTLRQARRSALACLLALALPWALTACGMGGSGGGKQDTAATTPAPGSTLPQEAGAPTFTGNIPTDGLNWINFRRSQIGMAQLTHNNIIDKAAQGHSDYQKTNNTVTHDQTVGKPGYTGASLSDRLIAAGYTLDNTGYAIGEVISATNSSSGFYMAEELFTAIYHRYVMFEPKFREIGTGAASTSAGYTYFTSDFGSHNGFGAGLGRGVVLTWPFNNQTGVATDFLSDNEAPDPVPNQNLVGYPVSVHADINTVLLVTTFTIRPRGGADLSVRLLSQANDPETKKSAAAAIIPLAALKAATTYDVTFIGSADGVAVSKSWAFTTK